MQSLCGQTVEGRVVSDQAVDADWIGQTLTVGPVTCETDAIRMPLAVGADASRTWVLSRYVEGLEFRHEHVEPDGSPSPVTEYGGYSDWESGSDLEQSFPADELTKANFTENGIARSNTNVWTFSLDDDTLTYSLARPATDTDPARDFRAEFDLRNPVDATAAREETRDYSYDLRDAERFAALFDRTDGAPTEAEIQSDYLDGAGRGVEIFTPYRIVSADHLAKVVAENPDLYRRGIDICLPAARDAEPMLHDIYDGLAELFPGQSLPNIHAVFGAGDSGGTAAPDGQVLGLEVICAVRDTREGIDQMLRFFFAHETVHAFQPPTDFDRLFQDPLLYGVLREGFADYVAWKVTGEVPDADRDRWARERGEAIWQDFERDRQIILASIADGTTTLEKWSDEAIAARQNWLGNYNRAPEGWPYEAGYWIGRQMVTAYIEQADDPEAAFRSVLALDDPAAVLAAHQRTR
ncbi:MAG: hypothetical protein WBF53_15475 [Litorimonas sp.]